MGVLNLVAIREFFFFNFFFARPLSFSVLKLAGGSPLAECPKTAYPRAQIVLVHEVRDTTHCLSLKILHLGRRYIFCCYAILLLVWIYLRDQFPTISECRSASPPASLPLPLPSTHRLMGKKGVSGTNNHQPVSKISRIKVTCVR